jgi:RNA polymerase sigma-70 factor, ECF subfamily
VRAVRTTQVRRDKHFADL